MRSSVANGTITAPPSKSYTHRAIILGTLTRGTFSLRRPLVSEDTRATLEAVHRLGADVIARPDELRIHCEKLGPAAGTIDARNSGTTIRLVTGIAATLPSSTTLTGDASLVRRPMGALVDALEQLGARCTYIGVKDRPPLTIQGPMTGEHATVTGYISSQFVSSLLIACTQKATDTELTVSGKVVSRPYVDITLEMMREFRLTVEERDRVFIIKGSQSPHRDEYTIPGDYSSAAFPLAAAAITGGDVTVRNLPKKSPQGDAAVLDHLRTFGADVVQGDDYARVRGGRLEGTEIDVRDTPDLFPILAVLGAAAQGETVLRGGSNLRAKESDRIATTTAFLRAMGADIHPTDDGCRIMGGNKLHGASISTEGDHRILMAAAVAALISSSETRIEDDSSYAVSYPRFVRDMHQLGCRLEVKK